MPCWEAAVPFAQWVQDPPYHRLGGCGDERCICVDHDLLVSAQRLCLGGIWFRIICIFGFM